MTKKLKWWLIPALCLILWGCSENDAPISGKLKTISLKNVEGQEVNIDFNDELLLLVFWATWCQPCIMEIPSLNAVNAKYKNKGLRVVSILTDNPGIENIRSLKKSFRVNYEVLLGDENLAAQYGIVAFPTSFLVIKGGKLVDKMMGLTPDYLFDSKIQAYLPGASSNR